MAPALPDPALGGLLAHWSWQPPAIVVTVALGIWYAVALRRVRSSGAHWPAGRTAVFGLGLALFVWTTCGWPERYRSALFWVWTLQTLLLLLIVPLVVLAGGPLQLARLRRGVRGAHTGRQSRGIVDRFLGSATGRFLANPLVGPALVPVLSYLLFFGPLPSWAVQWPALGWIVQLAVAAVGCLIVLPLVGPDEALSSLAVGLSLAIGSFELVLDAVPGIALRLHSSLVTGYFHHRSAHPWTPAALHDQQIAGAILWCVAEVIDLPFLLLVFRRWLRADARDAAQIDAVLEAERVARGGGAFETEEPPADGPAAHGVSDAPWWLSDPAMQRRYGNQ